MGRYYALHDGELRDVSDAIRDHYAPKGPSDSVPDKPVSRAVALADKLDLLLAFFGIGEKPTGSGDPYGLRRAALGVIRILLENRLELPLLQLLKKAGEPLSEKPNPREILAFIIDRLRVKLRAEGARYDVLDAVLEAGGEGTPNDELVTILDRSAALRELLGTRNGEDLLTAYRRASNILTIEDRKDGPHRDLPNGSLFRTAEERELARALQTVEPEILDYLTRSHFSEAMEAMARLRGPIDGFFEKVTVNVPDPELRRNRLYLLNSIRETMDFAANFSRIQA